MRATTQPSWNCVPDPLRSSSNAVFWVSARRYERVDVMASNASATWMIAGSTSPLPLTAARCSFGGRVAGDGREEVDATEQLDRDELVALHALELGRGEAAGLVEELIGHDELADVVHQRGVAESFHPAGTEAQLFTHVLREHRHPLRVPRRVPILRLESEDQSLDRLLLRGLQLHEAREGSSGDEDRHGEERHHCGTEVEVHPANTQPEREKMGRPRRSMTRSCGNIARYRSPTRDCERNAQQERNERGSTRPRPVLRRQRASQLRRLRLRSDRPEGNGAGEERQAVDRSVDDDLAVLAASHLCVVDGSKYGDERDAEVETIRPEHDHRSSKDHRVAAEPNRGVDVHVHVVSRLRGQDARVQRSRQRVPVRNSAR